MDKTTFIQAGIDRGYSRQDIASKFEDFYKSGRTFDDDVKPELLPNQILNQDLYADYSEEDKSVIQEQDNTQNDAKIKLHSLQGAKRNDPIETINRGFNNDLYDAEIREEEDLRSDEEIDYNNILQSRMAEYQETSDEYFQDNESRYYTTNPQGEKIFVKPEKIDGGFIDTLLFARPIDNFAEEVMTGTSKDIDYDFFGKPIAGSLDISGNYDYGLYNISADQQMSDFALRGDWDKVFDVYYQKQAVREALGASADYGDFTFNPFSEYAFKTGVQSTPLFAELMLFQVANLIPYAGQAISVAGSAGYMQQQGAGMMLATTLDRMAQQGTDIKNLSPELKEQITAISQLGGLPYAAIEFIGGYNPATKNLKRMVQNKLAYALSNKFANSAVAKGLTEVGGSTLGMIATEAFEEGVQEVVTELTVDTAMGTDEEKALAQNILDGLKDQANKERIIELIDKGVEAGLTSIPSIAATLGGATAIINSATNPNTQEALRNIAEGDILKESSVVTRRNNIESELINQGMEKTLARELAIEAVSANTLTDVNNVLSKINKVMGTSFNSNEFTQKIYTAGDFRKLNKNTTDAELKEMMKDHPEMVDDFIQAVRGNGREKATRDARKRYNAWVQNNKDKSYIQFLISNGLKDKQFNPSGKRGKVNTDTAIKYAQKALEKLAPNTKFNLYQSKEEFLEAIRKINPNVNVNTSAFYHKGVIYLPPNASQRDIVHEAMHALLDVILTDTNAQEKLDRIFDTIRKVGNKRLVERLDKYVEKGYQGLSEVDRQEERVAELVAILVTAHEQIVSTRSQIKMFVQRIATLLGMKEFFETDREVLNFLKSVRQGFTTGKVLTEADIAGIGTPQGQTRDANNGRERIDDSIWDVGVAQEFTSKETDRGNQSRLPALFGQKSKFRDILFQEGNTILDLGGGRYNLVSDEASKSGAVVLVYDKYNRTPEHNSDVINQVSNGRADFVTINNVLNVIKEPNARKQVLLQADNAVSDDGTILITVYANRKEAQPRQTGEDQFQLFQSAQDYVAEIEEVLPNYNVNIKNNVIVVSRKSQGRARLNIEVAVKETPALKQATKQMFDFMSEGFFETWSRALPATVDKNDLETAVKNALDDLRKYIKNNPNFLTYYEEDQKQVDKQISKIFPDTTEAEKKLFKIIMAITSNNTPLDSNIKMALEIFDRWQQEGSFRFVSVVRGDSNKFKFDKENSTYQIPSQQSAKMASDLLFIESIMNQFENLEDFISHMTQMVTIDEFYDFKRNTVIRTGDTYIIGKKTKFPKEMAVVDTATGQDKRLPRMMALGQKIGAYSLNLLGYSNYTTTDVWEARFVRSYLSGMFYEKKTKDGTKFVDGLPTGVNETKLFQKFAKMFQIEFEKEYGQAVSASALQAIRWFYIIEATRKAGYQGARERANISSYIEEFGEKYAGNDYESRGEGIEQDSQGRARIFEEDVDDDYNYGDFAGIDLTLANIKKIMKKLGISYDGDFSKIISADLIKDVLKRYGGVNFNYNKFFTKTRNFAEKVVASRAKGTTTRLRWSTDDYIANAIALIFTRNTIEQLREELALAKADANATELEINILEKRLQLEEQNLEIFASADRVYAREAGLKLVSRRLVSLTLDINNVLEKMRKAANRPLTKKEEEKIRKQVDELIKTEKEINDLEDQETTETKESIIIQSELALKEFAKRAGKKFNNRFNRLAQLIKVTGNKLKNATILKGRGRSRIIEGTEDENYFTIDTEKYKGRPDVLVARIAEFLIMRAVREGTGYKPEEIYAEIQKIMGEQAGIDISVEDIQSAISNNVAPTFNIRKQYIAFLALLKIAATNDANINNLASTIFKEEQEGRSKPKNLKALLKLLNALEKQIDDLGNSIDTLYEQEIVDKLNEKIQKVRDRIATLQNPKSSKAQRSKAVQELSQELNELRRIAQLEKQIAELEKALEDGDFRGAINERKKKAPKSRKIEKLEAKKRKLQYELRRKQRELEEENFAFDYTIPFFGKKLRIKASKGLLKDLYGFPRMMLAMADMSAVLRQSLWVTARHPLIMAKVFKDCFMTFFKEATSNEIDIYCQTTADSEVYLREDGSKISMRELGLFIAEIDGGVTAGEETFYSRMDERLEGLLTRAGEKIGLPKLGVIAKPARVLRRASERHMVNYINMTRIGVMEAFLNEHPDASEEAVRAYAEIINIGTGRGNLDKFASNMDTLSLLFFSPRFTMSRIQLAPRTIQTALKYPELRKELSYTWFSYLGTGSTVLVLASMMGADVGDDPEEADWGKIVVGDRRWDIWGGMQQPMRIVAMGVAKGFSEDHEDLDLWRGASHFVKWKLAPPFGITYEYIYGKDWVTQDDVSKLDTTFSAVTPIVFQSLNEGYKNGLNAWEQATITVPEFFGVGSSVYDKKSKSSKKSGKASI